MKKKTHICLALAAGTFLALTGAMATDLTVSSYMPTIWIDDTDTAGNEWYLRSYQAGPHIFTLYDDINNNSVIEILSSPNNSDSISIDSDGNIAFAESMLWLDRILRRVGIGTKVPQEELDIRTTLPAIRLDDTDVGAGQVDLMLNTNTFVIEGSYDQDIVNISTNALDDSLNITDTGRVGIGTPDPATKLHVNGAVTIEGDFSVLSSRKAKHEIEPVEHEALLEHLEDLEILSWRYIDDPRQARHLGPTAEQFHEIFGTGGDSRHLSPTDMAGVALASSQELLRLLRELQAETARLRAERDEVLGRLSELEGKLEGRSAKNDSTHPGI